MKATQLNYDVVTRQMVEVEVDIDFPNPRISEIDRRMQDIKMELVQGDWKTIKYTESKVEDEEYYRHLKQREILRMEYNEIEQELIKINGIV